MVGHTIFWTVVILSVIGHVLLLQAAWRIWRRRVPEGVTHSHSGADLAWSSVTAILTGLLLYAVYLALP